MSSPVFILIAGLLPVCCLVPLQIFLSWKEKKAVVQLIPPFLSILGVLISLFLVPEETIYRILLVLYGILLLILCGIGRILVVSVKKSIRN